MPLPLTSTALLERGFLSPSQIREYSGAKAVLSTCKQPPIYPAVSIRAKATGTTRLAIKVSGGGGVLDGEVVGSAGLSPAHKMLDAAALVSLLQCNFEPARVGGNAVDDWVEIEYVWKFEDMPGG